MPSRRWVIWCLLVGLLGLIAGTFLLLIPYRTRILYIDRVTGNVSVEVISWGVRSTPRDVAPITFKLPVDSAKAPKETSEHRFPVERQAWRLWSNRPTEERLYPGAWYSAVYFELFHFMADTRMRARAVDPSGLSRLFVHRTEIWRSAELDLDPQQMVEQIRNENARLFPTQ